MKNFRDLPGWVQQTILYANMGKFASKHTKVYGDKMNLNQTICCGQYRDTDSEFHSAHCPKQQSQKIYVASSWRNALQPGIVHVLRRAGHEVYDFRHPMPGNDGFSWRSIDPDWEKWTPEQYRLALAHPIAELGYKLDIDALRTCDVVVYVLPCGRSASWEFGYAMGQGKKGYVVAFDQCEPELMFREATILTSMHELLDVFLSKEREQEIIAEGDSLSFALRRDS